MNFYVAVTDYDWFQLHASKSHVDEVVFWRPSPEASFKALRTGEVLLFKINTSSTRRGAGSRGPSTRFLFGELGDVPWIRLSASARLHSSSGSD
jgi:hypothetical protein